MSRLLFVVNDAAFFLSHRLPIAVEAVQRGYEVHVATPLSPASHRIIEAGFFYHEVKLSRSGRNPCAEIFCIARLYSLMRTLKPGLVHLVTIKPVLYGGIAARLAGVPGVLVAVSGLGTIFTAHGPKAALLRRAVISLYRTALGHKNLKVVFQNPDDRLAVLKTGAIGPDQAVLIRGSGVNLCEYTSTAEPTGVPIVTMASRLLGDKGVREFIEAARTIKAKRVLAIFQLVGAPDSGNPTSITEAELQTWQDEGIIEYLGHRSDINSIFSKSNIVVLPSYREGLPKVLIEAAACGRPVVTTDTPGCRDAIEADKTGLLVPVKDVDMLSAAILRFLASPNLRKEYGRNGRHLAEREFSIRKVVDTHLQIYDQLSRQHQERTEESIDDAMSRRQP